jgi:MFS family permease
MALFSMIPEGAVLDWSSLYLAKELGAPLQTSGLAFAVFSGAMALMRFAGDAVRDRFGAVATLRGSAVIAATGMALGGLATTPAFAIGAFALAGLGMANTVPIAFSAGGNHSGLAPGAGLAVVTTTGYAGILVAPSLIGWIGEHVGLSPVYLGTAALMSVVAVLAGLAKAADRQKVQAAA